jgi:hypothetical protein
MRVAIVAVLQTFTSGQEPVYFCSAILSSLETKGSKEMDSVAS